MIRTRGSDSQSARPSLPSEKLRIMEAFLWNNKSVASRHEQRKQQEIQSLILSRLKRPPAVVDNDMHDDDDADSNINDRGSSSKNDGWNRALNSQTTTDCRYHTPQLEAPPRRHRPLRVQCDDDDDEDIVCCDGNHHCCREGIKNACTIAIWAVIVFFVINRFFVHMAMHLHGPRDARPGGSVRVVELGAQAITDVPIGTQPSVDGTMLP